MAHLHQQHASSPGRLTLHVTNLYCVCCAEELEARFRADPHISRARVGFRSKTVDVEYHATMIDEARSRALVDGSPAMRVHARQAAGRRGTGRVPMGGAAFVIGAHEITWRTLSRNNVARGNARATLVIDGLASVEPWTRRGTAVR